LKLEWGREVTSSALYDARQHATPSQLSAASGHLRRIERIQNGHRAEVQAVISTPVHIVDSYPQIAVDVADPAHLKGMWFYHLVFVSEKTLPTRKPRIAEIQVAVAEFYGVAVHDMLSARRTANVMRPRQVAYYLSKTMTLRSLPDIGRRFNGRDHTTILSGFRKIERQQRSDPRLQVELIALKERLHAIIA
jgi:hypothetical protein